MKALEQFGIVPVDSAVLITMLRGYKSPKDKIAAMEKSGGLIRLKKGLFVVSPNVNNQTLSRELVANHLHGPSYISLESALSFYGLIPEKVFAVRSVTTKPSKEYTTPLGNFEYTTVPEDYFQIGIRQEIINNQYAYLIATPEKAICDMIVVTRNLRLQSVKAMQTYLEDDLRIDFSVLETYNTDIVRQCLETGKKKTELTQLLKFLEQ
jgi:predicted transcriptional regulator of viral defense system